MPAPKTKLEEPSTFASRRIDREAREAAGEVPPLPKHSGSFRAGFDAEVPLIVITHA